MDDQMNPEARRMIDQVRLARTPSADDKERIRKALALGLAVTAASVPATAAGAAATATKVGAGAGAGAAGLASGLKVAVTVAVVASLGAGTYWMTRPTPMTKPAVATRVAEPVVAPEPAAVAVPEAVVAAPAVAPPPAAIVNDAPVSSGRAGRDPLVAELVLLQKAQKAWSRGNAARALELAQQHARRYPRSVLAMERDALRVFALCALGQTAQARPLAGAILKRAPGSPLRTSVEESCGGH
jgi:hypothetical protein